MKIALYAGSFDPFTNGHLDILEQASTAFDRVIIAVADNNEKICLLDIEQRMNLIKESIKHINNVEIRHYEGLTVDFAKQEGAEFLIRGLRNSSDFDYEMQVAYTNRDLDKNVKTVFFLSKPQYNHISSTVVKDLVKHNADISKFVPNFVYEFFNTKSN